MEKRRQILHIAMLAFAFLLAHISRPMALLCAVAAFLFNLFVLPRISRSTFRESDLARGYSTGMLFYPASVFILILIFPAYIAAGAWAVMALGDGFATIFGAAPGRKPLPWNGSKTIAGSIVFFVCAAAGAFGLMMYTAHFRGPHEGWRWFAFLAVAAAAAAATIESLAIRLDDNLSVPLTAGITIWTLHFCAVFPAPVYTAHILPALAAAGAVGAVSYAMKAVDIWGLAGGFAIGFIIYYAAGYPGFLVLLMFFVLGTVCTKAGYRIKESRGIAQERKGRRGLKHALANCAAGTVFAWVLGCTSLQESWHIVIGKDFASLHLYWFEVARAASLAFVASFAAAAADTVSSELGQVLGRNPVIITTFKKVPHGTNGGVTLTGTVLGMAGAVVLVLGAGALGLVPSGFLWLPVAAAFIGTTVDSYLGAIIENNGIVNNEFVNLCCTASAGLFAFVAAMMMFRNFGLPDF